MTISGLITFLRKSSVFQALITGGIVGLMMFAFSHVFQAPIQKHSDLQISAVVSTGVEVSHSSTMSVEQVQDITPVVTVQSWPPTPRGGGVLPALNVLHENLFMVGLSGVIPPPVLVLFFPAAFSCLHKITTRHKALPTITRIISDSITHGGIV